MSNVAFQPDFSSPVPLYEQLYKQLVQQINEGSLTVGCRLPGKRSLAAQLAVSVNTVDTAYQLLVAEGYLESRPRSGFFVQEVAHPLAQPEAQPQQPQPVHQQAKFDLSTGSVDTGLFPFRTWGKIQKELLYQSPELLTHGHPQGDENLRQAVVEYLQAYRAVRCSPEQVIIGAGVEYLVGLLGCLLPGSLAAVENPGYARPGIILANNGIPWKPVGIDGAGLRVDELETSGADLCYVTPSHHFPTGVTMPVGRRGQLLRWALAKPGRYILEDDYDAEFRFDIRPLPSLQGMAGQTGPVIYLFTFSKTIAPSIRIAGMVLPPQLMERYHAVYGAYSSTVSRFEQQTLARFMERGHFTRHLARMRSAYRERMEQLSGALERAFGERLTLRGRHTGLHLLVSLRDGPGEGAMVARAGAAGVKLRGLSEYYLEGVAECPPNTVVVGYASLPAEDIPELVDTLKQAWLV